MVFWLIPIGIYAAVSAATAIYQQRAGEAQLAEARTLEEQIAARRQVFLYQVQRERERMERAATAVTAAEEQPIYQRRVAGFPVWMILAVSAALIVGLVVILK